MIYTFDLDKILAETTGNDYPHSQPRHEEIRMVNDLYEKGNTIKIFTGRGSKSGIDWQGLTIEQLKEWGVKYHKLVMGKPDTDFIIDDKNISLATLKGGNKALIKVFVNTYCLGGRVYICGNGGLAAESSHFAAELMGKFAYDVYLPCFNLAADMALVTALGNDIGFENIFAHQIKNIGQLSDIFIGMTGSQSRDVVNACDEAARLKMVTIMVCGQKSDVKADYVIRMDGSDSIEIQNNAIQFLHELAFRVKKAIWEAKCHLS